MGPRRRGVGSLGSAILVALTALAAFSVPAFAAAGGLDPLLPYGYSSNGHDIYNLYTYIISPFAILVFLIVEGLILTVVIRFRRSRQPAGYEPPQWHGNNKLEITWTLIPFLILVVIGGSSVYVLQKDFVEPAASTGTVNLSITGHQFGWTFDYSDYGLVYQSNSPDGIHGIQPIVIPENQLVRISLNSVDVIHGFWIPDLTGKTDLVPGYTNYTWLKVNRTGTWRGQCTELCGVGHADMVLQVEAVSQADFQTWVANKLAAQNSASTPTPSPSPTATASPSPSPSASPSASPSPGPSPGATSSPSPTASTSPKSSPAP